MMRVLACIAAVATISCTAIVDPVFDTVYSLESIDGASLPVTLVVDYDITVAVVTDVIRLRADSTFLEIAEFRGVSPESELTTADTVSGTYTVSGSTMWFLTTGARATRMTIQGDQLMQDGSRRFVYKRR